MNKIYRVLTVVGLTLISLLFLMSLTVLAKELPLLVDVSELSEEYDGMRVTVMGWARSTEVQRGRLGSEFVKTEVGEENATVSVYSTFPQYNVLNNRVIIQGVYHHRGRFAGLLANRFIVADTVMRDWG